jgi:isochorismate synthase
MSLTRFFEKEIKAIAEELKKHSAPTARQPLSFDLGELDLGELLSYCACERVFYFSSKDKPFSFLGLGLAHTMTRTEVDGFLKQYPDNFLTTDLKFEDSNRGGEFVLHEWNFIASENHCRLVIFKNGETRSYSPPALILDPHTPVHEQDVLPPWSSYEEFPEHDEWARMIDKAHGLFSSGELQKIVLSRRKIFGHSEVIDPIAFFKQLREKNSKSRCFKIFHQPRFGEAFLCLTPEKLFSLEGKRFETISLAGSAPRGKTPEEDAQEEHFLRTNEKLIREHSLVTEELKAKLLPLSENLTIGELVTMKLPYIQHREADISATLKDKVSALDLISLLHPTPAIGGLPWDKARLRLQEIETVKRAHYAAPVGILSAHFSEIAVGIRSALIEAEKITIYGGAGIVKGSDAEEEWIETATKMNPFLKVIFNE